MARGAIGTCIAISKAPRFCAEELIDLYGGAEIDGHELDRLEDELISAREDANRRPEEWKVLTGWNASPSRDNEIWRSVEKSEVLEIIGKLMWLVDFAKSNKLKLIVSGD